MILLLHYDKMMIVEYSHACLLTLFHPIYPFGSSKITLTNADIE